MASILSEYLVIHFSDGALQFSDGVPEFREASILPGVKYINLFPPYSLM